MFSIILATTKVESKYAWNSDIKIVCLLSGNGPQHTLITYWNPTTFPHQLLKHRVFAWDGKWNGSFVFVFFSGASEIYTKFINWNVTSNEMAFLGHNFLLTHFKLRNYLQATSGNSSPQMIYGSIEKAVFLFPLHQNNQIIWVKYTTTYVAEN